MRRKIKLLASFLCLTLIVILAMSFTACNKACEHQWGEWSETEAATCTEDGLKERKCQLCQEVESTGIKATGHDYKDATCTDPKTCKNCSATDGVAKGHKFTVETVKPEALKSAATETNAAVYYKSCECGAISTSDNDTFEHGVSLSHVHVYDKETVKPEALKSEANCQSAAIYYKSCECGAVSEAETDTFKSGELGTHSYTVDQVKHEALKAEATCKSGAVYYKSCACGRVSMNDEFVFVKGNPIAHTFSETIAKAETLKAEATCQSAAIYYKSCACGTVSSSDTDTFTSGSVAPHSYTVETANADTLKSEATCSAQAVYYKSCECGAVSTSNTDVFSSGATEAHNHTEKVVKPEALKSVADCENAALYYYSCSVCGNVNKSGETFESGTKKGHSHQQISSTEATCEKAATVTYLCPCGDSYTETVGDKLGHDITGVEPTERQVEGCTYVQVYICKRGNCEAEVLGNTVEHHKHVATIKTGDEPTCQKDGTKTLTCSNPNCDDTYTETIPKDPMYHNWVKGTVAEGATTRTDKCSVCGEEKTVTVYTGTATGSTSADDLKDSEIELNDANITLDGGVVDAIKDSIEGDDKNVSVSAEKLEGDDRYDLGLSEGQLTQVGDNPIYNFTITADGDQTISEFGEDNYVTVTVPYKLEPGEDVNSIAVWFISAKCEDEDCEDGDACQNIDHKLVSIKATYSNGYVTFKTNHFSYYTVTRLTPEERCALHGHSFTTFTEEGSCLVDAYTLKVCVRCHISEKTVTKVAEGHVMSEDIHAATCTEDGYILYSCDNCDHSYKTKLNATGHSFAVSDFKVPSCIETGYDTYSCSNDGCEEEYTLIYPKANHAYNTTVIPATCETEGHTHYDCNNCDHEYDGDYKPALGHDYAVVDWKWSEDNKTAILTVVCLNDETHTESLNATVGVTVVNGTCSGFVHTTYTATVSFGGKIFTDEKTEVVGTPDHTYSKDWKYDDEEHWHECICGAREDVTPHTFENEKVTKEPTCGSMGDKTSYCSCGATHVDKIANTGKHTYKDGFCSACGAEDPGSYYTDLVASWKTNSGFAIKLTNFSYDFYEKDTTFIDQFKLIGKIKQLDVAELILYFEDNELHAAAKGTVTVFNGPIRNEEATYSFKAVALDGTVYISAYYGFEETKNPIEIKASVDELINSALGSSNMDKADVEKILDFIDDTVVPAIDVLVETNASSVEHILSSLFNIIFTFEKQGDGTYVATLDKAKLEALSKALYEKPLAEVFDIYFGEGYFNHVVDILNTILDLKISEIPEAAEKQGLNTEDLFTKINSFCVELGAREDFDVGAFFENEEYSDNTLGFMMFGEDYKKIFEEELVKVLRENTLYMLITGGREEYIDDAKGIVDMIVDIITDSVEFSFTTEANGTLTSIDLSLGEFTIEDYNKQIISFDLEVTFNGVIDDSWKDIIAEIESKIVLPTEDMKDEFGYFNCGSLGSGTVEYNGGVYTYDCGFNITIYRPILGDPIAIQIIPDCGDWTEYNAVYHEREFRFKLVQIEVEGEKVLLLINTLSGETAVLSETETGVKATYADGSTKEFEFEVGNLFTFSDNDNSLVVGPIVKPEVEYAVDKDYIDGDHMIGGDIYYPIYVYPIFDVEALVSEVFSDPAGEDTDDMADALYYYNSVTKEYAFESQHDIKTEYVVHGETCYDDGYTAYRTCANCDYKYVSSSGGCREEYAEIVLSDEDKCNTVIRVRLCSICGNVDYIESDLDCLNCNLSEAVVKEITDVEGNVIGHTSTVACVDCGVVIIEKTWREYKDSCTLLEYEEVYIYKDGAIVVEMKNDYQRDDHDYKITYELLGDSCEDGYYEIHTCEKCKDSYRYRYNGHSTNLIFSSDSSTDVCDDHYVEAYSCLCGERTRVYVQHDGLEYDEETGTYSCADCGLSYIQTYDEYENGCYLTTESFEKLIFKGDTICTEKANYTYHNHEFGPISAKEEDGKIILSTTCGACGENKTVEYNEMTFKEVDGSYVFDLEVYIEEEGKYCLDLSTYCRIEIYEYYGEELYCIGGRYGDRHEFWFNAGERYLFKIYPNNYYHDEQYENTEFYSFGKAESDDYDHMHNGSKEYNVLFEGALSCKDGGVEGYYFTECGCIGRMSRFDTHTVTEAEHYELSEFGACHGEVTVYECACGEIVSVNSYYCASDWTENEFTDGEGKVVHESAYTCSCGFRHTVSYYVVVDEAKCSETYYYTETFSVGANLVTSIEHTDVCYHHDNDIKCELLGGEGTSCDKGVKVTETCKVCGNVETYETTEHKMFTEEIINLKDYGSVCDGYMELLGCACGQYNRMSIEHAQCDLYAHPNELWIEDALDHNYHNMINGWNWLDYSGSYIHICAVTDPEPCAFKIRYGDYWLKAEGECKAYRYETWQFGYNAETGEYLYDVTFRTGDWVYYHGAVDSDEGMNVKYDCPTCGSYYYENYEYDPEGRVIASTVCVRNNVVPYEDKYREVVRNYEYDEDGRQYETYVYTQSIDWEGNEYWSESSVTRTAYTAPFGENGYIKNTVHRSSNGNDYEEEEARTYYKGYEFIVYTYYNSDDWWYKYDYTYTFDTENGCVVTEKYDNIHGDSRENTNYICYYYDCGAYRETTLKDPTCTQDGEKCRECLICGKQTDHYTVEPYFHDWCYTELEDGYTYCCSICELENKNGANGDIAMEDLTEKYGNGENYAVGYYSETNVHFTYFVSLVLEDGSVVDLAGVDYFEIDGMRVIVFSKAQVKALAEAAGYTDSTKYEVRFSFVPYGADGSFDYGLTFTKENSAE